MLFWLAATRLIQRYDFSKTWVKFNTNCFIIYEGNREYKPALSVNIVLWVNQLLYLWYWFYKLFHVCYQWFESFRSTWKMSKCGVISGPYFSVFGLNTKTYGVNLRIQSKFKKIRTRNNSLFGHFSRSDISKIRQFFDYYLFRTDLL